MPPSKRFCPQRVVGSCYGAVQMHDTDCVLQVLKLVDDLRNHPATYLLAQNYSVVVSSDDPGLWGALPMSHDVYELFLACTPMDQGLKVLKRLTMDSIR